MFVVKLINLFQINLLSQKCNAQNIQNFTEYIKLLKLARSVTKFNEDLLDILYNALFKFVEKPDLFNAKISVLTEMDSLHQDIHKRNTARFHEPQIDYE